MNGFPDSPEPSETALAGDVDEARRPAGSRTSARANYDRLSRWYDRLTGDHEQRCTDLGLSLLRVQPSERVLEVGSGTGRALLTLGRHAGQAGSVLGVDLAAGMCAVAHARVRRAGLSGRVGVIHADAARLPIASGTVDAVFMAFTLELFDAPDRARVLRECWRALRPGGRFGVVSLDRRDRPATAVRLYEWLHRRMPAVLDCRPIPVAHVVAEAGFTTVEIAETSLWGLPIAAVLARRPWEETSSR